MSAAVFAKMMAWIVDFVNQLKALFDEFKEILSGLMAKVGNE